MYLKIKTHIITFSFLLSVLSILFIQCYAKNLNCKDVRNGTFHYYAKQLESHYLVLRQDSIQKEVDMATNDTTYWKIEWIDDCKYTANYLSGGKMKSEEEQTFLRSHTTIIQIQKTTTDYYIVKGALDSLNSTRYIEDTIWMTPK